jgi:hypothetical protein
MEDMLGRLLPRIGGIGTVERLAALSGSDFTSVMLEVIRRRADRETPASVLRRYERDRFVRPGPDPRAVRRAEEALLGGLPGDVEVVQLAPLVPLGTHSALGPVSQDKVVSTVRACEVAADPTNALALEAASRRARARDQPALIRLAAVQRVVRAQRIAAAVSAGLAPVTPAGVVTDRERQAGRGYYRDLCFKVSAYEDGEPREVGDGGFTDWTARLTANQKERLLILGLSTDRLAAFAPAGRGG